MGHYPRKFAADIAKNGLENLPNNPRVLDVGGGPLTYATAFAQQGTVVTILDLPEVIDMMILSLIPTCRSAGTYRVWYFPKFVGV